MWFRFWKNYWRGIADLPIGLGRYSIAPTSNGGAYMGGILFRLFDHCFCYVQPDSAFEKWLITDRDGFDVTISDATSGAINEEMRYFDSGFYDLGGQQLCLSRTG